VPFGCTALFVHAIESVRYYRSIVVLGSIDCCAFRVWAAYVRDLECLICWRSALDGIRVYYLVDLQVWPSWD